MFYSQREGVKSREVGAFSGQSESVTQATDSEVLVSKPGAWNIYFKSQREGVKSRESVHFSGDKQVYCLDLH